MPSACSSSCCCPRAVSAPLILVLHLRRLLGGQQGPLNHSHSLCRFASAARQLPYRGTFALATSLAAKSDLAHAAAHQICLQLWLASSLLADSLAVAAQTLMAQGVAANELRQTRKV